ncbi:serine hydrolase [uncultured Microscilla sp.]|uniref:serine hydrolase domain-containing protein n=1 Tax=uncultured Microscilla sp. TaxID=432653 RepID=UPI00260BAECF|nr:serine hydrolase domain-containing protein [uncultured Microscilla sp.]
MFKQAIARQVLHNNLSDHKPMKKADSLVNAYLDTFQLKGASMAIVKDGQLVYAKGYGYADKEAGVKVHPGHKFRIASVSKLVTAVAVMKLIDEKKLALNDTVFGKAGILNDSLYTTAVDQRMYQITVRQLLNHTAGWCRKCVGDPIFRPLEVARKLGIKSPPSLNDVTRFVFARKLWYAPGSHFGYSNYGYAILGEVVAKIAGVSYEKYVQGLLAKLDIKGMRLSKNLLKDRAPLEVKYYEGKDVPKARSVYNPRQKVLRMYGGNNLDALAGAGAWIASPVDLMKLVTAIDGFDNVPDILSKDIVHQMMTPDDEEGKQVLGWRWCSPRGCWRTGSLGGSDAVVTTLKNGISWAFVTNTSIDSRSGVREIYGVMAQVLKATKSQLPDVNYFGLKPPQK